MKFHVITIKKNFRELFYSTDETFNLNYWFKVCWTKIHLNVIRQRVDQNMRNIAFALYSSYFLFYFNLRKIDQVNAFLT